MKLAIYDDLPKAEKITMLKLERTLYGITLVAVDEAGKPACGGFLLDITRAGRVVFRDRVNPDLGFDLDSDGRVVHS